MKWYVARQHVGLLLCSDLLHLPPDFVYLFVIGTAPLDKHPLAIQTWETIFKIWSITQQDLLPHNCLESLAITFYQKRHGLELDTWKFCSFSGCVLSWATQRSSKKINAVVSCHPTEERNNVKMNAELRQNREKPDPLSPEREEYQKRSFSLLHLSEALGWDSVLCEN